MLEKISNIICKYADIAPGQISVESELRNLGLTSFDVMNIIAECELEFNVVIPEREIRTLLTIGDMIRFIDRIGH